MQFAALSETGNVYLKTPPELAGKYYVSQIKISGEDPNTRNIGRRK